MRARAALLVAASFAGSLGVGAGCRRDDSTGNHPPPLASAPPPGAVETGMRAARGRGAPLSYRKARDLLSPACTAGQLDACAELGRLRGLHKVSPPGAKAAKPLLERACEGGVARGCGALAEVLLDTPDVPPAAVELRDALARACDQGSWPSCRRLAELAEAMPALFEGQKPPTLERAREIAQQACQKGDAAACTDRYADWPRPRGSLGLGSLGSLGGGERIDGDDQETRLSAFKAACKQGDSLGCAHEAEVRLRRADTEADRAKAREQLEKACEREASACLSLASMLLAGAPFPRDRALAASLFGKACSLGSSSGCAAAESLRSRPSPAPSPSSAGLLGDLGLGTIGAIGHRSGGPSSRAGALPPIAVGALYRVLREGCDRGDGGDCADLGGLLERGSSGVAEGNLPPDPPLAEAAFERGCRLGSVEGCRRLMLVRSESRARQLGRSACLGGDGEACLRIAAQSQGGAPRDARPPSEQALSALGWGCYHGEGEACSRLCEKLAQPGERAEDTDHTARLLLRACSLGAAEACALLGERTVIGRGVSQDLGRALELYKQACYQGGVGCDKLALPPLAALAVRAFELDCQKGEGHGCEQLAQLLSAGKVVPRDNTRAGELLDRGCELGAAGACAKAAARLDQGEGGRIDMARAQALHRRACFLGLASSCYTLSSWLREGRGVARDEAEAEKLRLEGCDHDPEGRCEPF